MQVKKADVTTHSCSSLTHLSRYKVLYLIDMFVSESTCVTCRCIKVNSCHFVNVAKWRCTSEQKGDVHACLTLPLPITHPETPPFFLLYSCPGCVGTEDLEAFKHFGIWMFRMLYQLLLEINMGLKNWNGCYLKADLNTDSARKKNPRL